jgi:ribA/ribD-fused uncharacterized protein
MNLKFSDKIRGKTVHYWPSNFYIEPDNTTVENEFQAAKTLDLRDQATILTACDESGVLAPGWAKALGRKVSLRFGWEDMKLDVMKSLLLRKALDHAEFVDWLLESGEDPLTEENWWHDNWWGVCLCRRCVESGKSDRAKNALGHALEEVRFVISTWDEGLQHGHDS